MAAETVRILCVAGSPRRHGNSEDLLDSCVAGIRSAGGEPDVLIAAESGISPCRGCNSCSETGVCIIDDAMQAIYERIDAADAIIVSSPVYFATVPAVLKIIYDRCQPYWARSHVLEAERPPRRPGGILLVRAGGDPFGFDAADATTRSVYAVLGVDVIGQLRVEGADQPGAVAGDPETLEAARSFGAELAARARKWPA